MGRIGRCLGKGAWPLFLLVWLGWLAAPAPSSAITVPLTVANREAAGRAGEPITSGVPFAQGVVADVGRLRLLQGSTELPAQFLVTARWPDGSIRWVLVDTQIDLPSSGSASLTLETGTAPVAVAGITVSDTTSTLTVDTLARAFVFTKTEFAVRGHSFQVQSGGITYLAVPGSWTVDETGPMKTVVRVDGVWRSGGSALVNDLNRFRARLVFFRNKGDVRVHLTFRNNNSYGWDEGSGGQPQQPDLVVTGATFGTATLPSAGGSYHFGSGVEKTWEVDVADSGVPSNRQTRFGADGALIAGDASPRPLAAASASYYASTKAWGTIGLPVSGQAADRQADFDRYERIQRAKVDSAALENPPGLTGITAWGHLSQDVSSWNDYGDLRWGGECGPFSSNHYDWPYGMFLQFMRTGRLAFADLARVMARHETDFDIYHTGADSAAFNYQKNWETRPSHDNPANCFGGGRPSHTWSQGYALFWLLTGDWRGKDAFDEIQEGVRQYVYESFNGEGYINTSELRIQGWLVENLVNLWRINPDAVLTTSSYGNKTIRAAITDVLRNVFDREAAAGGQGFVLSDPEGFLRQTLPHVYFLDPAIKAYDEVLAGRDTDAAAALLGLITRMTQWVIGTVYGGDSNAAGAYRPRQIPYWVDTRLATQSDGQLPYLLMAANSAGFLYTATSDTWWRDRARELFQDYIRYVGGIGQDSYGDPSLRTPASYNSNMFPDTESKIHGWSNRYGQYFLASEAGAPGATATVGVSPATLRYGATKAGAAGALLASTGAQAVTVTFTGGSSTWTAAGNQAWIQVTGGSGSAAGRFTVSVINTGNAIGGSTSLSGAVTITAPGAQNSPVVIPVTLTVDQSGGAATAAPFGQVDTPVQNATGVQGAIGVSGWALDDLAVTGVKIYRNCLAFDNQAGCFMRHGFSMVFIGDAAFVAGARPDVEAVFPTAPQAYRGGWGYLMLTNMLPHVTGSLAYGGQGTLTLYAIATDVEGKTTLLGRTQADATPTTITMANDTIAKPFGAIDTPAQGETVSGLLANFGWVLTRDTNNTAGADDILMPIDGSTMTVVVDGVAVGKVTYNQCRGTVGNPVTGGLYCNDDVANIFGNAVPQPTFTTRTANVTPYRNLDADRSAIGSFAIDTTLMSNGMHNIAWGVTDSAGRVEGIGSRNFIVLNAGSDAVRLKPDATAGLASDVGAGGFDVGAGFSRPLRARVGFDFDAPFDVVPPNADGIHLVQLAELGRLELRLGRVDAGYLLAMGERRDLPAGSHLDTDAGVFTWAPGPGFLGTYAMAFVRGDHETRVDVIVRPDRVPDPGEGQIRMHLDVPVDGQAVGAAVTVAGWALDPQAAIGSGIGSVHVWAQRRDRPSAAAEFLGTADLGGVRPDVAAAFGRQFGAAAYGLTTAPLAPGVYDVTVYVRCVRTGRWEDARTVTVTVR